MSWLDHVKNEAFFKGRSTSVGRRLLSTAAIIVQPADWYARRYAAVRYNQQFPSTCMTAADGYAVLPSGSLPGTREVIDTCRRLFDSKLAKLGTTVSTGREALFTKKGGKKSFLRNMLDDEDLSANPVLVDFALSDPLLSIVTNYLGTIPNLNRVDLVYSVPRLTPEEHVASQLYHQDFEGLRQAKLFLNIFDVGEEHGPFTFIPANRSERLLTAIRQQRRQAGAQHEGHYRDDEVGAHGGLAATVQLTGPAGTASVVDTSRCLHAGSRVRAGYFRLCLYIQFCTTREKANTFDAVRFRNDPVRWLAVKRFAAEKSRR